MDPLPRPGKQGRVMRMRKMEMLNTTNVEYQPGSNLEFCLHFDPNIDESNVRLRITITTNISTPVGMTQTRAFDVKAGEPVALNVCLPLGNLSAGEYNIKLSLVSDRFNSDVNYYDVIYEAGQFTIVDNPELNYGLKWLENAFGNVRLPQAEIF